MLNVTLLRLTSLMGKSLKILFLLPIIVMYVYLSFMIAFVFSGRATTAAVPILNIRCVLELQVPHVNRTDYQLIDISEDGFVRCFTLFDCFFCFGEYSLILCKCCRWAYWQTVVILRTIWSFQLMTPCSRRLVDMIFIFLLDVLSFLSLGVFFTYKSSLFTAISQGTRATRIWILILHTM